MKSALVTGAYGYIGSVLCKMLNEQGYSVIGIDSDFNKRIVSRIKYCDQFLFTDFIGSTNESIYYRIANNPNISVFHLAANSLLGPSVKDPLPYFYNNVAKTIELITYLGPNNNFIFASSAAIYNNDDTVKNEEQIPHPPNNYGLSKLMVETVLNSVYDSRKIRAASFRFFNVIGAYEDTGQLPDTPHIVNQLIDKTLQQKAFIINGDNYNTPDGTCIRDYLHVVDVCRALIHADNYLTEIKSPCHKIYNLGTNTGTSVMEIVKSFKLMTKSTTNINIGPRRQGDPDRLIANPSKFMKETNFKYKYNSKDINSMIKSAWDYRNNNF